MTTDTYRTAIREALCESVARLAEERSIPHDQAFNRVAAECLGYAFEDDDPHFVDGVGDRGIDFWSSSEQSLDIFQCKTHDPVGSVTGSTMPFDDDGVKDLSRCYNFLFNSGPQEGVPDRLKPLLHAWNDLVVTAAQGGPEDRQSILVNLTLVVLGEVLTPGAQKELDDLRSVAASMHEVRNAPVEMRVSLLNIADLANARWRADNREWADANGKKRSTIDLTPESAYIGDAKGCVFYCRALDLVSAFQQFGYQIFEPNVRCNIKRSKVNEAIRNSAQHEKTRHVFKYLNNGLTIVCKGYVNPNENRPSFRVTEPGVVNGLQTVIALHGAYSVFSDQEKADFEKHCHVLVRLVRSGAVGDVNGIVRATNTQNPMEPRNLRSNSPEQVLYEKLFAEVGWFYERKDGAWEAFRSDPGRWRSLPNKRPVHFQYSAGAGRPRERRVDNEVLAQSWLAFIGMSNQAVHQKRYLFENDKWYDLIFGHRLLHHGAENGYPSEPSEDDRLREGPAHSMMLAAYIARRFAYDVAPSNKENRDSACERKHIDQRSESKEDVDKQLSEDPVYLAGQVLNGMSFVFTEAFGYMLYTALGDSVHQVGKALLSNGIMGLLSTTADFDEAKRVVRAEKYKPDDVMAVAWAVFSQVISEMVGSNWRYEYLAARGRTQFNHSPATRMRVKEAIDEAHRFTLQQVPMRVWARSIEPGKGLFGFFKDVLLS